MLRAVIVAGRRTEKHEQTSSECQERHRHHDEFHGRAGVAEHGDEPDGVDHCEGAPANVREEVFEIVAFLALQQQTDSVGRLRSNWETWSSAKH
eukprot:6488811-Amphidinium_carterae.1